MDEPADAVMDLDQDKNWRISVHTRQALGYLFAALCLVWVFHDIRAEEFLTRINGVDSRWLVLAIVCDVISYVIQGRRWQLLLRPINPISLVRATQAIYVGLFTNEVLPLRVGELVRACLAARWLSCSIVSVVPSIAIERLFDGIWLALGIGLTAIFVPLPHDLQKAADVLGGIILLATGLVVFVVLRKRPDVSGNPAKPRLGLVFIEPVLCGLRTTGRTPGFYFAFVLSLAFLGVQALAFWLVMWACGMRFSFWIGLVVLLILHLGTAIPNAPANVGSYQFFVVAGLSLFGVEKAYAAVFSVLVFIVLTIPIWAVGFFALSRSGTTLMAIRRDLKPSPVVEAASE